jgi:redox-sensitive bicupin YhaK (pirin superfamily)
LLEGVELNRGALAILSLGERVSVTAKQDSYFLLLAGEPVNEPVIRVMNTEQELKEAFFDTKNGRF